MIHNCVTFLAGSLSDTEVLTPWMTYFNISVNRGMLEAITMMVNNVANCMLLGTVQVMCACMFWIG